jgi:hypothetical protein
MDLLDLTVEAHGGLDRWNTLSRARAHVSAGGGLWTLKHQEGVLADTTVTVELDRQWTSHEPFAERGLRSVFTTDHVAVESTDGHVVEERDRPREAFAGHTRDTPWDHLHVVYFGGYAMWTYLTTPFVFTRPRCSTSTTAASSVATTTPPRSWRAAPQRTTAPSTSASTASSCPPAVGCIRWTATGVPDRTSRWCPWTSTRSPSADRCDTAERTIEAGVAP